MKFLKTRSVGFTELAAGTRRFKADKPQPPKPERNAPCQCGSGKKYKKCCLLKEQEKRRMQDVANQAIKQADKPSVIEAAQWLTKYVNQRVMTHNATVTHLSQLECALEALPESEERNFVLRDTKRRINELTGDSCGRDTVVLKNFFKLAQDVQALIPEEVSNEAGQGQGTESGEAEGNANPGAQATDAQGTDTSSPAADTTTQEAPSNTEAAIEQAEKELDAAIDAEIDDLTGNSAPALKNDDLLEDDEDLNKI
jgi:hypothetical protein